MGTCRNGTLGRFSRNVRGEFWFGSCPQGRPDLEYGLVGWSPPLSLRTSISLVDDPTYETNAKVSRFLPPSSPLSEMTRVGSLKAARGKVVVLSRRECSGTCCRGPSAGTRCLIRRGSCWVFSVLSLFPPRSFSKAVWGRGGETLISSCSPFLRIREDSYLGTRYPFPTVYCCVDSFLSVPRYQRCCRARGLAVISNKRRSADPLHG